MNGSGFFISFEDLRGMDPLLRSKLQGWFEGGGSKKISPAPAPSDTPTSDNAHTTDEEKTPSDLSVAQAKKVIEGCGEKTKSVLRLVFSKDSPSFVLGEIAKTMKTEKGALGGVWAGLTKRTRTVLGDKGAALFHSEWDDARDDWVVKASDMTYRSMRKALGIQ